MGFLAPWFLGGIALLGVPVFVHLLRRHVTIPRPVSSLMFFERGIQSSTRHRRLKHLLLFALRCALIALIILAFANPFVRRVAANPGGKLLVIVLDNSFSMRAGTRFADAKRQALARLAARPQSQPGQIIALGGKLQLLTQPITDGDRLRAALESVQPGDGHASFGELGHAIRALAETVRTPIDVNLYSDMQRTAMPANFADLVLPANAAISLHPVASGSTPANWTVESVDAPVELSDPKDPRTSRVRAVVAGFSTPAATRTVSLAVSGKVIATRRVEVPASGRATVEFAPLDVAYGFNRCEVRIERGDALAADDASVFTVRRSDPERVLFVHASDDARSAVYFGAALKAGTNSSFLLQSVREEESTDLDPSRFSFVVLSDTRAMPAIFEHSLAQFVQKGGNVFIALGTHEGRHARIPVWNADVTDVHNYARSAEAASVGQVDFTHPALLNQQPGRDNGGWAETKVFYAATADAGGAQVVARLNDGTPFVLDKQMGQGHVLLLASGLENLTNDLPLHPVFVAFVDRVARYLSGSERRGGSRLVDSYVQLHAPAASQDQGSVEVIGPDGRRLLSLSEARAAQTLRLENTGFYQIRLANGRDMLIGVNPDRRESDLQPIADDVQKLWAGTNGNNSSHAEAVSSRDEGFHAVSLWWYVMLLALIVALAETAFASGYLGTQREEI
ncbi:MAG TPA: BatA and WFA domain-containing protein [Terracidiphilus sp.]|nr:BatA and WFA domain-containing protein [Terracidiphilus sp.]